MLKKFTPALIFLGVAAFLVVAITVGTQTSSSETAKTGQVQQQTSSDSYNQSPSVSGNPQTPSQAVGSPARTGDDGGSDDDNATAPSAQTPPAATPPSKSTAGSSGTPSAPASGYTMAQVQQHATAQSCWTAINGSVYNLTNWINQHPGGPGAILGLCGTDGSAAFNGQHGGQARPARELAGFRIGALK